MQRPYNWNTESQRVQDRGSWRRTSGPGSVASLEVFVFIPRTMGDSGSISEKVMPQVFREYNREIKGKHLVVTHTWMYV